MKLKRTCNFVPQRKKYSCRTHQIPCCVGPWACTYIKKTILFKFLRQKISKYLKTLIDIFRIRKANGISHLTVLLNFLT